MAASRRSIVQEPGFPGPLNQALLNQAPLDQAPLDRVPLDQVPIVPIPGAPISGAPAVAGRQAGRRLRIQACLALVTPIARHYARITRESADDLTQVGLLGLLRAAELYVPSRGEPFEPFARQHIRGAVLHYLRDQAPLVRVPRRRQELDQQRRRCENRLQSELGQAPPSEAVRQAMGLSPIQWERLAATPTGHRIVALDERDEVPASDQDQEGPGDARGTMALALLEQLPPQQAEAIKAVILAGRSLRQVASEWGTSASTVHRQLHRGLSELRRRLEFPSDAVAC